MKFLAPAAILVIATVVSAVPGPTECDTACIEDAGTKYGCTKDDYWCQCEPDTYSNINNAALSCVLSECGIGKAAAVISAANGVCGCASSNPSPSNTPAATSTTPPVITTSAPVVTPSPTITPSATLPGGGPTECDVKTSAIPACATACIETAGSQYGCAKTDYYCQCEPDTFNEINNAAFNCVLGACGITEGAAAAQAAAGVCSCVSSYPLSTAVQSTPTSNPETSSPDVPSTTSAPTTSDMPTSTSPPTGGPKECDAAASTIPTCAVSCIEDAGAQFGCSKTDYYCQCEPETYDKINNAALNCVLGACGISQAPAVLDAANAVCECASSYPPSSSTAAPTSLTSSPVIPTSECTTSVPTEVPSTTPAPTGTPICTQTAGPTECDTSASAIPSCATACIESAGAQFGCSKTDYRCQCEPETFSNINNAALNCVLDACGISQAPAVIEAANSVCACASSYPVTAICTALPSSQTSISESISGVQTTTKAPTTTLGTPTSCSIEAGPTECDASTSAIPPCATACIESAGTQFGCSKTDYRCQCEPETFSNINNAALNCVLSACGISQAPAIVEAANSVCACASSYPASTCSGGPTPTHTGSSESDGSHTKSSTLTYTITSCAPTVTNCPIGHVTTTVVPCPTEEPNPGSGNGGGPGNSGSGSGNGGGSGSGSGSSSGSGTGSGSGSETTTAVPPKFTGSASNLQPFIVAAAAMFVTIGVFAARY